MSGQILRSAVTLWLSLLCCQSMIHAEEVPLVASFSQFELARGETPNWNAAELRTDDAGAFFEHLNARRFGEVIWIRWKLNISSGELPERDMVYWVHNGMAAFELYWDGKLIGKNGTVAAARGDEVPGKIESEFLLPNTWITQGEHQTGFKLSAHYRPAGYELFELIEIRHYDGVRRYFSLGSLLPTLLVSISLMIGLYFFALYFSDRSNRAYLVFGLLCSDLFIFGLALQWPHMIGYRYDWYVVNIYITYATGLLFPILLPLFFLMKYGLSRFWPALLLMPAGALVFVSMENGESLYWALGLLIACVLVAWTVKREKGKYWWELLGLLICLAGVLNSNTDLEDFFYFFPLLVIFILVSNAVEAQRERLASHRFQLRSSQLEAQLLRKNIQPHFILNSLASLIEWVETAPDKSVEFICALADEFRLFAEVSGKDFIAIGKELELCRQHLAIMMFRLQRQFSLSCEGFADDDQLPPGILHTLIENAFTHNDYGQADIGFEFSKREQEQGVLLRFDAPLVERASSRFEHLGTGTGFSYIRSQMKQGYGESWRFREEIENGRWVTELFIDSDAFYRRA